LYFDDLRISSGRDDEVVLETTLAAIIDHVDPGIDLRVTNAGVIRNVGAPCSWISAREIITACSQGIETFDLRRRIRTFQFHSHDRAWRPGFPFSRFAIFFSLSVRGWIVESHNRFSCRQEKNIALATREEFYAPVSLSLVE